MYAVKLFVHIEVELTLFQTNTISLTLYVVTSPLIYYPRSPGFFQHFNAELISKSANFEPHHHGIHYAHNSLQLLSDFLTIIFLLLGLRAISQMMPNYDMCQGLSEPALGFRWSLVYIIICLCCSSRTLWNCLHLFENKDGQVLSSTCRFLCCLVLLPVHVDIVQHRCKQLHHMCGELVYTYWHLTHT